MIGSEQYFDAPGGGSVRAAQARLSMFCGIQETTFRANGDPARIEEEDRSQVKHI